MTPKVPWGSTVGYPSDSLASCTICVHNTWSGRAAAAAALWECERERERRHVLDVLTLCYYGRRLADKDRPILRTSDQPMVQCRSLLWWYAHATIILLWLTVYNDDLMYDFFSLLARVLSFFFVCFNYSCHSVRMSYWIKRLMTYLLTYLLW